MFTGIRRQCKTPWLLPTCKRLALSRGQLSGILRRDGKRVPSSVAGLPNGPTNTFLSSRRHTTSLLFALIRPAGAHRLVLFPHTTNSLPPTSEPQFFAPATASR